MWRLVPRWSRAFTTSHSRLARHRVVVPPPSPRAQREPGAGAGGGARGEYPFGAEAGEEVDGAPLPLSTTGARRREDMEALEAHFGPDFAKQAVATAAASPGGRRARRSPPSPSPSPSPSSAAEAAPIEFDADAKLEPIDLAALEDRQYAPLAAGLSWLTFAEDGVTLPLPLPLPLPSSSPHSPPPWRWAGWAGTGTTVGQLVVRTVVLAPIPSTFDPSRLRETPSLHRSLPLRLVLRTHDGLLSSDFLRPIASTLPDVAKLLADLHMMRHMPPGLVREHEKKQPPQILHTWERNLGAGGGEGASPSSDSRRAFGIEYEGIMDKGYPSFRHSLSLILDPQADRIHEISLAAPANEWDPLWEGMDSSGVSGAAAAAAQSLFGDAMGGTASGTLFRCPLASEIGLGGEGKGLQLVFDHVTVAEGGGGRGGRGR
jgi:hypothetical protein